MTVYTFDSYSSARLKIEMKILLVEGRLHEHNKAIERIYHAIFKLFNSKEMQRWCSLRLQLIIGSASKT